MKYVLDTNIVARLLDADERVLSHLTMETFPIVPVGPLVVRRYATVRAAIESIGRPKSDFDLMIACTALEQNATLVTHDAALKDGAIAGLVIEDWL